MTRIVQGLPPNHAAITAAFRPLAENVVFAYGDTIYSPAGIDLPADLIAHEQVHFQQQADVGGPEEWWRRYIADPGFRLAQEVEAYRAQVASHHDRSGRRECARRVARDLAGGMYGRLVSKAEARRLVLA